jgi:hypothetical protein
MTCRRSDERDNAHSDSQGCVEKTSQHWIVLDLAQIAFCAREDDRSLRVAHRGETLRCLL